MEHLLKARDILGYKSPRMICVPPDATLGEAIEKMVGNKIGAMLVKEGEDIVGIWSERDHLMDTLTPGYDPKTARIRDYMKTDLHTAEADTSIIKLQELFLGLYIRHILIVEQGKQIGLLSIGDVMRATLIQKDRELKELYAIASWEYYENWGWHHKYKDPKKDDKNNRE